MSKAKSIRKKVLKKNKEVRRNTQGLPREKSNGAKMGKMMKEFNAFVRRKQYEESIRMMAEKAISHEEAGLPEEVSGQDLLNFLNTNKTYPEEPVIISTPYVYEPSLINQENKSIENE